MKIEGDRVVFSSGRRIGANDGIVGLSEARDGELRLTEGYDDIFRTDPEGLSPEEAAELADYMIALWTRFKAERGPP